MKNRTFTIIAIQNFIETCIQYLLLLIVYEGYFSKLGYSEGCANLSFTNYVIGGEYAKFIFWSIPTYFIQTKWLKTDTKKTGIFIVRNAVISFFIYLFISWRSDFKYIRCSSKIHNNVIHVLEILLAGLVTYCILKIIVNYYDRKKKRRKYLKK